MFNGSKFSLDFCITLYIVYHYHLNIIFNRLIMDILCTIMFKALSKGIWYAKCLRLILRRQKPE